MKKILFFVLIFGNSYAQNVSDSVLIMKTAWKIHKIGKGVIWKNFQFKEAKLFNSIQNISILETKLHNRKIKFALASADSLNKTDHSHGVLKPTSEIAAKAGAIAAVNAGFFDIKNGGAVDFIKINKQILDTTRLSAKQRLPFHAISALTIQNNNIEIVKGEQEKGWEDKLPADYVLLTGPLLIQQYKKQILPKTPFNDNRHPRTCACITDKKLLLITVDGRSSEAQGMTLEELSNLAMTLGCKDAINFDGGGSTTMWIKGEPENGVVNYPSDNKKFDHAGERSVSNVFVILPK